MKLICEWNDVEIASDKIKFAKSFDEHMWMCMILQWNNRNKYFIFTCIRSVLQPSSVILKCNVPNPFKGLQFSFKYIQTRNICSAYCQSDKFCLFHLYAGIFYVHKQNISATFSLAFKKRPSLNKCWQTFHFPPLPVLSLQFFLLVMYAAFFCKGPCSCYFNQQGAYTWFLTPPPPPPTGGYVRGEE
jgi:hypothetical protein